MLFHSEKFSEEKPVTVLVAKTKTSRLFFRFFFQSLFWWKKLTFAEVFDKENGNRIVKKIKILDKFN